MVRTKHNTFKDSFNNVNAGTMVETRAWKVTRGLTEDGKYRLCREQKKTVEHLLAGCKKIANSEYLTRHNRALMVMAVAWAKEYRLVKKEVKWYKERWTRGHVLENARAKLVWDLNSIYGKRQQQGGQT